MPREALGDVEHLVLLALLRLREPQYGVPIMDEIETRTGRQPSRAAIYIALQRLEAKGLVSSVLREGSGERGGRPRRYFTLKPRGVKLLASSRRALVSMWQDVETLLEHKT